MDFLLLAGIALAFILWIAAELNSGPAVRITLALISMAGIAVVTTVLSSIHPGYERRIHIACMKELEASLRQPDSRKGVQAVTTYNRIVTSQSSAYAAAMEMWKVLQSEEAPPTALGRPSAEQDAGANRPPAVGLKSEGG